MPSASRSILLIADPILPVPPPLYGGIERVVHFLAEELASRGWRVMLACHPDSACKVPKIAYPAGEIDRRSRFRNLRMLIPHLLRNHYDIVHSFGHLDMLLPFWPFRQVVQSFQSPPDWRAFGKRTRWIPKNNLYFTTCGYHMVKDFADVAPTRAIHNGVRIEQFDFIEQVPEDAPLVFLGRVEPIKGTHHAITIAKATNRRLIIAGNRSERPEIDRYFVEQIEPHLSEQITYIGSVNDEQKNRLLGNAAALLMPIEWDEPFGIVMAEALACGTPVIGFARGALPEIVENGTTGACCNSVEEMIEAVKRVGVLSRQACRREAERRFSAPIIVAQYLSFYESILAERAQQSK